MCAMHAVLQQDKPSDYVIATGVIPIVCDFVHLVFGEKGLTDTLDGESATENGMITTSYEARFVAAVGDSDLAEAKTLIRKTVVSVDLAYFCPTKGKLLIGNPNKSQTVLSWESKYDLKGLVGDMMRSDIKGMKKDSYLKEGVHRTLNYFE